MNKLLIFIGGVLLGSVITYKYCEETIFKKVNADLEDYKNEVKKESQNNDLNCDDKVEPEKTGISKEKVDTFKTDYSKIIKEQDYNKEAQQVTKLEPYTISPNDFGDYMDYEQETLTYYSDGVLVNDDTEEKLNIKDTVGEFFADHFGENDDPDIVYVRNDDLRKEFEIYKDERPSSEVLNTDEDYEEYYDD